MTSFTVTHQLTITLLANSNSPLIQTQVQNEQKTHAMRFTLFDIDDWRVSVKSNSPKLTNLRIGELVLTVTLQKLTNLTIGELVLTVTLQK